LAALDINQKVYGDSSMKGNKEKSASFFQSSNGINTVALLYYAQLSADVEAASKVEHYAELILDSVSRCFGDKSEDELLYGNAGYLYCLLKIAPHVQEEQILGTMQKVCEDLIAIGTEKGSDDGILLYQFRREGGKFYFGGAHGLIGILYMLLCCWKLHLPSLSEQSDIIKATLDFLVKIQLDSGNFPSSFGKSKDSLLHFCHGAPGAIPLMLLAHELYDDDKYLKSALKAGEKIWKRGILLKGFGLCHGTSGNAYFLHSIYRATGDIKWQYRAFKLALATTDADIQEMIALYADASRQEVGMPDTPYSLMEGSAGHTIMLADMIMSDTQSPLFPGYEI